MALLPILTHPDERLHIVAKPVEQVNDRIHTLVADMAETMYASKGIGLAATQVNVHERVVVIDLSEEKNQLIALINPVTKRGACLCRGFTRKLPARKRLRWNFWIFRAINKRWMRTVCWQFAFSTSWITCWASCLCNICRR